MKNLIVLIALCLSGTMLLGQSKTVLEFEESANGYNLYLYQSLIRVLNQTKNPEFNKLIKDLDHLRFITSSKSKSDAAIDDFQALDENIVAEGFESIMTFDNNKSKVHIYEYSAKKSKSIWVATFIVEGRAGLIEMVGSLNLKYLNSLNSLDFNKIQELLPLDGEFENWD